MKKNTSEIGVNKLEVDLERHKVPLSIVKCIDPRFNKATLVAMAEKYEVDIADCDQLAFAGGAYRLAEGDSFALGEVEASVALHHPDTLLITSHTDCGKLKVSGICFDDHDTETSYHREMLERAADNVRLHLESKGLHVPEIRLELFDHQ
ncbi:MAG: hypothetical protein WCO03_00720 [bacterium]